MKKEKENIHFHIISEDYRAKKNKQNQNWDILSKPVLLSGLQSNTPLVEQLKKMHEDLVELEEPELLQVAAAEDSNQIELQSDCQSLNPLDISELITSYQKLKTEEQELIDSKQDLLAMEQGLRNRLIQEIGGKKKAIEELQGEISALQNICKEIQQELDIQPTTN
jgi:hypothetical protein